MGGGGGKGGKGGGGGGGSIEVTSTSTSMMDSDSTANITSNSTSTNDLTSTSNSTNQIDSRSNAEMQMQIVGLDNVRLKADTTADNKTQLEMDLKPLQVDLCFKVGLERFPSTRICKPINRHFGFTVMGVEVVGFNYVADDKTVIEDLGHKPFVIADPGLSHGPGHHHEGHHHEGGGQGVKVRLA
jgi:hypothetical protein